MSNDTSMMIENATAEDATALAKLIDIAGEGIPAWLWQRNAEDGQSALAVGTERARREAGGFSYKNAMVARDGGDVLGMVLSYPITEAPEDDPKDLPAPIAPFVALEAHSVGTWYINALAVFPAYRGRSIGTKLLEAAGKKAAENGYDRLSIQVYGQNFGAVRLYSRLGFVETKIAPVIEHPCQPYYTGNVLLLIK